MAAEPHRRLYLDRQLDREHLGRDAGEIQRVAHRHATGAADADPSAFTQCEDTLVHAVVAKHDVTVDQVRAAIAAER
jgi:hypothetical protein